MRLTGSEAASSPAERPHSAHFLVLRGRAEILRLRPVLTKLSERCGQAGAMDYLEYFLTATENLKKTPHLVLVARRRSADLAGTDLSGSDLTGTDLTGNDLTGTDLRAEDVRAEELCGAVLVYEYRVLGVGSRVFTTCDFNGRRAVLAPDGMRGQISALVCSHLMERGAQVVLLSLDPGSAERCQRCFENAMVGARKRWWTTQVREAGGILALEGTLSETLAGMGKHTRRNFKYYRRKAEAELGSSFVSDVGAELTMADLVELNRASTHPVAASVLRRRFETIRSGNGFFGVGLKQATGEWISLMGGRRHHGVTEIDWQTNRAGLAKYSVGTVIRSYLIESEIALGTGRLFFEGGTPHPMRHSFLSEQAMDIVVMDRSLFVFLLQRSSKWLRPRKNFLLETLRTPAVKWQLR